MSMHGNVLSQFPNFDRKQKTKQTQRIELTFTIQALGEITLYQLMYSEVKGVSHIGIGNIHAY